MTRRPNALDALIARPPVGRSFNQPLLALARKWRRKRSFDYSHGFVLCRCAWVILPRFTPFLVAVLWPAFKSPAFCSALVAIA